jgi:hypothetical protein
LAAVVIAFSSKHKDSVGRAAGDLALVAVGVVVAADVVSRPAVALHASGQRIAHGGAPCGAIVKGGVDLDVAARWHHVVVVI